MHNGTLKCLRTKNGHALWANMDARSPSHLSRESPPVSGLSRCVCRVLSMCAGRAVYVSAPAPRRPAVSADNQRGSVTRRPFKSRARGSSPSAS